ncbi:MAG: MliC family protein [Novosphingobium sp.]|nr:MliC family protein [Novosphingobium sp.]
MKAVLLASTLLSLAAQPAMAAIMPADGPYGSGESRRYQCDNDMAIVVTRHRVNGHAMVEVAFPSGRTGRELVSRMLPATQTGSGVRYASDITVFHEKGEKATFETAGSAASEAIGSTACTQSPASSAPPLTQGAHAGQYFTLMPGSASSWQQQPTYLAAETVCFVKDGSGFMALTATGRDREAVLASRGSMNTYRVGEVDAGLGQRRYSLHDLDTNQEMMTLQFIAPGMREADQPSATAGLTSVTSEDARAECIEDDRIVYAGHNGSRLAVVTLEDTGGLTLRAYDGSSATPAREIAGGYHARNPFGGALLFFDGQGMVRIETGNSGNLPFESWLFELHGSPISTTPKAFFVADTKFVADAPGSLHAGWPEFLGRLTLCNHLAGETSGNAERDAQVMKSWEASGCDTVEQDYARSLAEAGSGSALHRYLKVNSPSWM